VEAVTPFLVTVSAIKSAPADPFVKGGQRGLPLPPRLQDKTVHVLPKKNGGGKENVRPT